MEALRPISMSRAKIKTFASSLGYPLKPYQVEEVHTIIHTTDSVVYLDGGRQTTGKSHILIIASLILAIAGRKVLFSIHRKDGVRRMMKRFTGLTAQLRGSDLIEKEALSNGFEEIFFTSGGCLQFRARTDGIAVGMSYDVVIYDEAQLVNDRMISDIDPTTDSSDFPLKVHLGTPPKDEEFNLAPNAPFTVAFLTENPKVIRNGLEGWWTPTLQYSWEEHGSKVNTWRSPGQLKKLLEEAWAEAKTDQQREAFFRDKLSMWKKRELVIQEEPVLSLEDLKKLFSSQGTRASAFYAGVGILPESQIAYVAAFDGRQLEIVQEVELSNGSLEGLTEWLKAHARKFRLIRIPANQRGQALAKALEDRGLKAKVRLVTLPELSSSIDRFMKNTASGEWTVYERPYVKVALGSFWFGFDKRSGSIYPECGVKQDQALVLSLFQASVDQRMTERARNLNGEPAQEDLANPKAAKLAAEIAPEKPRPKARARAYGW